MSALLSGSTIDSARDGDQRDRQREPERREEQMPAPLLVVMSVVQAIQQVEEELTLRRRRVEDEPVNQVLFEEIEAPPHREQPERREVALRSARGSRRPRR